MAKSLVIRPDSMVSIQADSKHSENFASSPLSSNLALWVSPLVQAKIEATN